METRAPLTTYLKLLLMAVFWGGTFVAGRLLAGEVAPFSAAFLRFSIASLALLWLTLRAYGRPPVVSRNQWLPLLILGLSGVLAYNAFFFKGLERIEAGRAAVIIANNPILIGLFAALLFGEKLTGKKIVGILLSICGAIIVITKGQPTTLLAGGIGQGELLIFGCVVSWVIYSLVGRVAMRGLTPLVAVTYAALIGTGLLLFPALGEGVFSALSDYSLLAWICLLYLSLCGTVLSFVWYYQGIQQIGSTRAGQFINLVPVSAVLLSAWLLDEPVTGSLLVGLLLVSGGIYLNNRQPKKTAA
jgi:drug/metabolite transporter (DMT)-like permease